VDLLLHFSASRTQLSWFFSPPPLHTKPVFRPLFFPPPSEGWSRDYAGSGGGWLDRIFPIHGQPHVGRLEHFPLLCIFLPEKFAPPQLFVGQNMTPFFLACSKNFALTPVGRGHDNLVIFGEECFGLFFDKSCFVKDVIYRSKFSTNAKFSLCIVVKFLKIISCFLNCSFFTS
jgi:hypothetical protein